MIVRDTFLGDWWSSRVGRRRVDDVVGDRNRKRTAADSPTSTVQPRRRSGGTGCGLRRGSTNSATNSAPSRQDAPDVERRDETMSGG